VFTITDVSGFYVLIVYEIMQAMVRRKRITDIDFDIHTYTGSFLVSI